jgi:hypothetical protein
MNKDAATIHPHQIPTQEEVEKIEALNMRSFIYPDFSGVSFSRILELRKKKLVLRPLWHTWP